MHKIASQMFLVVVVAGGCASGTVPHKQRAANGQSESAHAMTSVSGPGYSIDYPSGWELVGNYQGVDSAAFAPRYRDNAAVRTVVGVTVKQTNAHWTPSQFYDHNLKSLHEHSNSLEVLSKAEVTLPSGVVAIDAAYQEIRNGETIKTKLVVVTHDTFAYVVTCSAIASHFDRWAATFARVSNSFTILGWPTESARRRKRRTIGRGYSIEYPIDWELVRSESPGDKLPDTIASTPYQGPDDPLRESIGVRVENVGASTLAQYLQSSLQLSASQTDNFEHGRPRLVTLNSGVPAYEVEYTGTVRQRRVKGKIVLMTHDTTGFAIISIALASDFEVWDPKFNAVVGTFVIDSK